MISLRLNSGVSIDAERVLNVLIDTYVTEFYYLKDTCEAYREVVSAAIDALKKEHGE